MKKLTLTFYYEILHFIKQPFNLSGTVLNSELNKKSY